MLTARKRGATTDIAALRSELDVRTIPERMIPERMVPERMVPSCLDTYLHALAYCAPALGSLTLTLTRFPNPNPNLVP